MFSRYNNIFSIYHDTIFLQQETLHVIDCCYNKIIHIIIKVHMMISLVCVWQ